MCLLVVLVKLGYVCHVHRHAQPFHRDHGIYIRIRISGTQLQGFRNIFPADGLLVQEKTSDNFQIPRAFRKPCLFECLLDGVLHAQKICLGYCLHVNGAAVQSCDLEGRFLANGILGGFGKFSRKGGTIFHRDGDLIAMNITYDTFQGLSFSHRDGASSGTKCTFGRGSVHTTGLILIIVYAVA